MLAAFLLACTFCLTAQNKLSIDKVYSAYLRNSGTIVSNKQIKGYFFLYQSDKIDKNTNEYTLQILDENLNKVKDIKFEDSKTISLIEAAYNSNSLAFLFNNMDENTTDLRVYDLNGKLKFAYSNSYDRKTENWSRYATQYDTEEGGNNMLFDLGEKGYATLMPLSEGKHLTYQLNYFNSQTKQQWSYTPDDEEKISIPEFLGVSNDVIILQTLKKSHLIGNQYNGHMIGVNFVTKRVVFDIDNEDENEEFKFVPTGVEAIPSSDKLMVLGSYFNKKDNIVKDFSQGLAIYTVDGKGKILSKTYNSWARDFSKYIPTNAKGKFEDVGYVFIHKVVQLPDGKLFVVGEGFKRQASITGIALKTLGAFSGGNVTKVTITDLVIMEFDNTYKVTNATIYNKTNNNAAVGALSDRTTQHAIGMLIKAMGLFDYEFTTTDTENGEFTVTYSDWVRDKEYTGQTFNSLRYNGTKFTQDKIELKSKASRLKIYPAKAGSIMIMEYFKKDKRLDFRLEKLG